MENYTNRFFMGYKTLAITAAISIALFSCTEETTKGNEKDSLPPSDTNKPVRTTTVSEPTAPVSKRVADSIYNGTFEERYDNGVIRKKGDISGGLAHGEWLSFYPSGKIWSKGTYKNGLRTGYAVSYYENGEKSSEGYYNEGRFTGKWIFWDERGNKVEKDYGNK